MSADVGQDDRVTTAGLVLVGLAAILHVYIFWLESFAWTSPRGRATFGTTPEQAEQTRELAYNQGFYNLFLAVVAGLGVALVAGGSTTVGAPRIPARCDSGTEPPSVGITSAGRPPARDATSARCATTGSSSGVRIAG